MSQAPSFYYYDKETDQATKAQSILVHDGLTDAFSEKHMGLTAEKVADVYQVTREAQDEFALQSHEKAAKAQDAGYFDAEIIEVEVNGVTYTQDEGVRRGTTLEQLAKLRTVFKEEGCVTAGNASTINDGASALILASKEYADDVSIFLFFNSINTVRVSKSFSIEINTSKDCTSIHFSSINFSTITHISLYVCK